jgi:ribonuclease HI
VEKKKKKFYAVAKGRNTGIFSAWFGPEGAEAQIKGFAGARYKGFSTIEEARQWLKEMEHAEPAGRKVRKSPGRPEKAPAPTAVVPLKADKTALYTDGGCSCNPGPGGYGAVILKGKTRKEVSGGFRLTTNNRMELMACIEGFKALKSRTTLTLYSDSRYVVNGISKGWAEKWRGNGWMRTRTEAAENYDLWEQLLDLCGRHTVEFVWVKGHAGNRENERCDQLATGAAAKKDLPRDRAYENGKTRVQ